MLNKNTSSPIRGIYIGDEYRAIRLARLLIDRGFGVTTAMYPTVEEGKSIIRVALSSLHTYDDIKLFYLNFMEIIEEERIETTSQQRRA